KNQSDAGERIGPEFADEIGLNEPDRGLHHHYQHVGGGEPQERRGDWRLDKVARARVELPRCPLRHLVIMRECPAIRQRVDRHEEYPGRSLDNLSRCAYIGAYTHLSSGAETPMNADTPAKIRDCMCLAVRQAARHVTASYDQFLAPAGLRTTQFSILATLRRQGPMPINARAAGMLMSRTTLGRNILPLERDGLIRIEP